MDVHGWMLMDGGGSDDRILVDYHPVHQDDRLLSPPLIADNHHDRFRYRLSQDVPEPHPHPPL